MHLNPHVGSHTSPHVCLFLRRGSPQKTAPGKITQHSLTEPTHKTPPSLGKKEQGRRNIERGMVKRAVYFC